MTNEEIDELCHTLTIEEVGRHADRFRSYISRYFGFSKNAREERTPEFIAGASKRLEGKTEYCCECGEDYPSVDLHFYGEIYCQKCRKSNP